MRKEISGKPVGHRSRLRLHNKTTNEISSQERPRLGRLGRLAAFKMLPVRLIIHFLTGRPQVVKPLEAV